MSAPRSTLQAAALAAAASGLYVFPCQPRGKTPALHGASGCEGTGYCADGHQGWEQCATRDEAQIRDWWRRAPFNVAAAVGRSNLLVIDLDHGHGETAPPEFPGATSGMDVLEMLAERAGQPAPWDTYSVGSPSGGLHLYFRAPAGSKFRNTAGEGGTTGLGWCIDTRGHGGYIIAANSVGRDGPYRVVKDLDIAPLPPWLVSALTKPEPPAPQRASAGTSPPLAGARASAYVRAILDGEADTVRTTRYGQGRNHALNRAAFTLGRLIGAGELDEPTVRQALLQAAACHIGIEGFTEAEAQRTVTSGVQAGCRHPRHVRN
jgi:hypothetical protein